MKGVVFLICILVLQKTSNAQLAQVLLDSIQHVIKMRKYNQVDRDDRKQGFWIEIRRKRVQFHHIATYLYSGYYFDNRKIGVWDLKLNGNQVVTREVYLDSTESRKEERTYFSNGNQETEAWYCFNRHLPDTVWLIDKNDSLVKEIVFGKYVKDGKWKEYWENGTLKVAGSYKQDARIGSWLYYNADGTLISRKEY